MASIHKEPLGIEIGNCQNILVDPAILRVGRCQEALPKVGLLPFMTPPDCPHRNPHQEGNICDQEDEPDPGQDPTLLAAAGLLFWAVTKEVERGHRVGLATGLASGVTGVGGLVHFVLGSDTSHHLGLKSTSVTRGPARRLLLMHIGHSSVARLS